MNICSIGCYYRKDLYAYNFDLTSSAIEKVTHNKIKRITSNCSCFASSRRFGITKEQLLKDDCSVIKLPFWPLYPSNKHGKLIALMLRIMKFNIVLESLRGVGFFLRSFGSDLILFDQVLKSFGCMSLAVLLWLSKISKKRIIVLVHEIDPMQLAHMKMNKLYNAAARVLVYSEDMLREMQRLGVLREKLMKIYYPVRMASIEPRKQRANFVFFGGHHLNSSKGIDTLIGAVQEMRDQLPEESVVIHTGNNCDGVEEARAEIHRLGLSRLFKWSEFVCNASLDALYQSCLACIIPYESGSGKFPATVAMSNATPIIATRQGDIAEYVGDLCFYIGKGGSQELAERMIYLKKNPDIVSSVGKKLRKRAAGMFSEEEMEKNLAKILETK